ncbi:MAG: hypothetical protein ACJ8AG_08235 [Ktedonobacteraceae bacterium]
MGRRYCTRVTRSILALPRWYQRAEDEPESIRRYLAVLDRQRRIILRRKESGEYDNQHEHPRPGNELLADEIVRHHTHPSIGT